LSFCAGLRLHLLHSSLKERITYTLTKREKIMIGAAVCTLVFLSFYLVLYQPKRKELLRLQKEINNVDLVIEEIVAAIPSLSKLEEEVAREQKGISLVRKMTSAKQPMQELLRQLAEKAYRLNMDVISLESGNESKSSHEKSPYKKMKIVMNIQCAYRHLGEYLRGLSDLHYLTALDELEIVRDQQTFPKLQVKLTLTTFISHTRV
jgi:Tfp pilus assembly protein PilO